MHTYNIKSVDRTGETIRIVFYNIRCLVDPLDRTGFNVELVVAKAIPSAGVFSPVIITSFWIRTTRGLSFDHSPFFWCKVPVSHGAITQVFPDQNAQTTDNVPHHTIA